MAGRWKSLLRLPILVLVPAGFPGGNFFGQDLQRESERIRAGESDLQHQLVRSAYRLDIEAVRDLLEQAVNPGRPAFQEALRAEAFNDPRPPRKPHQSGHGLKGGSPAERRALRKSIAKLLLAAGADPDGDRMASDGYTPLFRAVYHNRDLAFLLLEMGAEVNTITGPGIDSPGGQSPVFMAVPDAELVRELISRGADVNLGDEGGAGGIRSTGRSPGSARSA